MFSVVNNKWVQHLAFWTLSVYIIGSYFSMSSVLKTLDFVYALCFHGCLLPLVYVNLRILIPKFFERSKFLVFVLLNGLNVFIAILIHDLIFDGIIPKLGGFYMVSFTDKVLLVQIFGVYLATSTLLRLSESWFRLQKVEKEKVSLELETLKGQLNPHFLFNGLNSIYSLALKKDDHTPAAILKLSNLLRFVLYEVSDDHIPLTKEIEMIRDYVDLQRIRFKKNVDIQFHRKNIDTQTIAPMLMLPVIENAFKHGNLTDGSGFVRIELKTENSNLHFSCSNTVGSTDDPEGQKNGGIGLENIRKRLDHLYPKRHNMEVIRERDIFTVKISAILE